MDSTLMFAIFAITFALVFYTFGVFAERMSKSLNRTHVIIFWLGLICDIIGTLTMKRIALSGPTAVGSMAVVLHGMTGFFAILLMLFHAVWATWVYMRDDELKKQRFHRFSMLVWCIWLFPYVLGMLLGMS